MVELAAVPVELLIGHVVFVVGLLVLDLWHVVLDGVRDGLEEGAEEDAEKNYGPGDYQRPGPLEFVYETKRELRERALFGWALFVATNFFLTLSSPEP